MCSRTDILQSCKYCKGVCNRNVLYIIFSGSFSVEMPIHTWACSNETLQTLQVFLDEVNTSSCLGLFKEIIVDRSFDGKVSGSQPSYITILYYVVLANVSCVAMFTFTSCLVLQSYGNHSLLPLQPIPDNVFIVAACNPHRGNSLASHCQKTTWVRGSYYVRQLHPTLRFLMWDYGSLDKNQERNYIIAKMNLLNRWNSYAEVGRVVRVYESCMRHCFFRALPFALLGYSWKDWQTW